MEFVRRLPIGAEVQPEGGVHFRVWAPRRQRVQVVLEPPLDGTGEVGARSVDLERGEHGYFAGLVPDAGAGTHYRFHVDDDPSLYPDPASRLQPDGVHGPSAVVDPSSFEWSDANWPGVELRGQVIYEMHVGTFTAEGTWAAAARELAELKAAGITTIEMMPLAEFPGRFGWGYDGVDLFAPTHLYGTPDDLRRFVDTAHQIGLGVILDVVYNHFGPSGNYVRAFSSDYMHHNRANEWGESLNFDEENCEPVREFFIANAGYWIDEYHFDGLWLDATQAIHDSSSPHLLLEISRRVRAAAGARKTLVMAENERQEAQQIRPEADGGYGLDAAWNDDFHHSARVAMTGTNEYYYADYRGRPQELLSAVKWGYLFQGQRCKVQQFWRGTPSFDVPAPRFVLFLENHDQIANSATGERPRLLTTPGRHRALTALLLLAPSTPLLFQGQEFGSTRPFLYFADHEPHLAELVRKGRFEFLSHFDRVAAEDMRGRLPDPENIGTFERCKLDFSERNSNSHIYQLHKDLLRLRREDPVFSSQRGDRLFGAVLSEVAFLLRFLGEGGDDRLLIVNLGEDLPWDPAPEPLLAPPLSKRWRVLWSSENPIYGGLGTPAVETENNWRFPANAAVVLAPGAADTPEV